MMPSSPIRLTTPLTDAVVSTLHAGDQVLLTGPLFTARDAAHQRLSAALDAGQPLPIDIRGQIIYYCGPTATPPHRPLGSAGPTSSYRMDAFTPRLHALGLKATIGKGDRSETIRRACVEHCAVYLVTIGGAGALLADRVSAAEVVAYEDLGPEAIRLLRVADFPAVVAYDCHGASVFPGDETLDAQRGG